MSDWHQKDPATVLSELRTDPGAGLSQREATLRLGQYGPNELRSTGIRSPWRILWEQLTARMVLVLIAAAILSALLGDYKDMAAISAIVVLNAALGFSQDYRAEKALAALERMAVPVVKVRRDGEVREVPAARLVPGDIILLEAGALVAADCRVLESADLQTLEASLTGESEPIRKNAAALQQPDIALGDRRNMAYLGTVIVAGRGVAVVTETGMRTELGHIANMIETVDRGPTPLQRRLDQLGKTLALAALFLVAVIFLLGLARGESLKLMLLAAVSIGVAAVPEGLPAVVTIALTLGAQRMLKRRVLIRKLPAVETLGSVTVICTDKTGTLTGNRMTVQTLESPKGRLDLSASSGGDRDLGTAFRDRPGFALLLALSALTNDAHPASGEGSPDRQLPMGDPTETALVVAAARFGVRKEDLDRILPRVAEIPFASERKMMATLHAVPAGEIPPELASLFAKMAGKYLLSAKGAVDSLLEISNCIWVNGNPEPLGEDWRRRLAAANERMAGNGMRVLGVAFRVIDAVPNELHAAEQNLTFVGMAGMIDPPRPEAAPAVSQCKTAGIRPVMITGDHPLTARYIAREVGILDGGAVLAGPELDRIPSAELENVVESTSVYARVSPKHKLRIVEGLSRRGHIVAMTGDGVNDAPALKRADIGVAMGMTGTDVAKEAADMVLMDDNFATIVAAVKEGRVIYDNIRKFIRYILSTNSGEIWVMLIAPFLGMPLPLLPLQILWMNLVTDGLPALALGVELPESDTMRRPPHPPKESIFARGMGVQIVWVGLLMGALSLGVGYVYWRAHDPEWQTMVFSTLTLSQMANVMAIRSDRQSVFRIGLFSNRPLVGAVGLTLVLQLVLVYVPFFGDYFSTTFLSARDLGIVLLLSAVIFFALELEKWMRRTFGGSRN
jgi:P-type Ca2+ transporter type 2C